jgi:hypothetical protein
MGVGGHEYQRQEHEEKQPREQAGALSEKLRRHFH